MSAHPEEDLLLDYAAGRLAVGHALVVAGHLEACPSCARTVAQCEAVGAALMQTLDPAKMAPDALERALARIDLPEPAPAEAPAGPREWITVGPAVARAARRRRWAAPGVWTADVVRGPGRSRAWLLGVAAGVGIPHHSHRGSEFVLVLSGGYSDRGRSFVRGDFMHNDESVTHSPLADEDCVCLIATEGPLVARSWLARVLQPIVGV